ncbi:MAG: PAS domain-containing protein [Bacteroidia bacterium]|nr:PAS domain-containing protein [Bacteroidia bacterium]
MDTPVVKWIIRKLMLDSIYRSIQDDDILAKQRFNLFRTFNLVAIIGIGLICYQAIYVFQTQKNLSFILLGLELLLILNYLLLNVHRKLTLSVVISLLSCFGALHYITYFAGGIRNSGMFYQIAFILISFMLLGSRYGIWFTVLSVANMIYFFLITEHTNWVDYSFIGETASLINQDYLITSLVSLIVISSLINNLESKKNVVISTITDSRNKLAIINKELKKLSLVASKTDNAVVITNENGVIEWVNEGFTRITGYQFYDAKDQSMPAFLSGPETDKENLQKVQNSMREFKFCDSELLRYKKDGATVWLHASITPISDNEKSSRKFIFIMSDVNERKKAEIQLNEYLSDLEKTNKELDKFAYIVSHDLKAPLRAIGNLTDWITQDSADSLSDESKENFQIIKGRVKRMEQLINAILEYSKVSKHKGTQELFSFNEIIHNAVDLAGTDSNCKVEISGTMPEYYGDKVKYQQVFMNLISNGIKHNNKEQKKIEISCREEGKFWEFMIKDNGPGIDKRFHEKVFVIFQTLKARDEFESTGIGLSIVKKIVEEAGGSIRIESTPGEGAAFYFTVPKNQIDASLITGKNNQQISPIVL